MPITIKQNGTDLIKVGGSIDIGTSIFCAYFNCKNVQTVYTKSNNSSTWIANNLNGTQKNFYVRAGSYYPVYWYATPTTGCAAGSNFGSSSNPNTIAAGTEAGTLTVNSNINSYTLTYNVSGGSYISAASVSRTSSPKQGASTGDIASGTSSTSVTIYYGDTLTCTATPAINYSAWQPTSLSGAPTASAISAVGATIKNNCSVRCYLEYKLSSSSSWTTDGTFIEAGASKTIASLSSSTSYDFRWKSCYAQQQTRTKTTYTASATLTASTVTGNVTCNVTGSSTPSAQTTEYQTSSYLYSSSLTITTASGQLDAPTLSNASDSSSLYMYINNPNSITVRACCTNCRYSQYQIAAGSYIYATVTSVGYATCYLAPEEGTEYSSSYTRSCYINYIKETTT